MLVTLTEEQVAELGALLSETVRDMSHEIAATENPHFRAGLVARRRLLEEVASSLRASPGRTDEALPALPAHPHEGERVWTIELGFAEDDDRTRADARVQAAKRD